MAQFLDNTILTGYISKMVELPENYVINGQMYDKSSLTPIPLKSMKVTSCSFNEIMLNTTVFTYYSWCINRVEGTVLQDNQDTSISYVITQNNKNDNERGVSILKVTKQNGNFVPLYSAIIQSSYAPIAEFISQDNQYLYLKVRRKYSTSTTYYYTINKSNLATVKEVNTTRSEDARILFENSTYIYHALLDKYYNQFMLYRYNKVDGTNKILVQTSYAGNLQYGCRMTPIDSNGNFYGVTDRYYIDNANHVVLYKRYNFNKDSETLLEQNVEVDYSFYKNDVLQIYTDSNYMECCAELLIYNDKTDGKKYITHFNYDVGLPDIYLNVLDSAMFTYEVIDENNWKMINYTEFGSKRYVGLLPVYNNSILIAIHESGCDVYTWDVVTKQYLEVGAYYQQVVAAGVDLDNNVFIQFNDSSVEMISKVLPMNVYCDFEKDEYDYEGNDVYSNVIVFVKSIEDKFLSGEVKLQLSGNVVFTDTGTKSKTTVTSTDGPIKIPVTILGPGALRVTIQTN